MKFCVDSFYNYGWTFFNQLGIILRGKLSHFGSKMRTPRLRRVTLLDFCVTIGRIIIKWLFQNHKQNKYFLCHNNTKYQSSLTPKNNSTPPKKKKKKNQQNKKKKKEILNYRKSFSYDKIYWLWIKKNKYRRHYDQQDENGALYVII